MSQKYTSSRQSIDLPRIQKGTRHTRDGVKQLLENAVSSGQQILPCVVRQILEECEADEDEPCRKAVFEFCVQASNHAEVNSHVINEVFGKLLHEVDTLKGSSLVEVAELIIKGIKEGSYQALELFPKLLSVISSLKTIQYHKDGVNSGEMEGSVQKSHLLNTLCGCRWEPSCVLHIADMCKDISMTQEELEFLIQKILRVMKTLDLSELPPLVYQLLVLSNKGHKKLVIEGIQALFNQLDNEILRSKDQLTEGVVAVSGGAKELLQTEGTVILHISFALKQGQDLRKEYLKSLEAAQARLSSSVLSPFSVALSLSVARMHRFENDVFKFLKDVIMKSFKNEEQRKASKWMQEVCEDLPDIDWLLMDIVERSSCGWDHVLQGLVMLGFNLMEFYSSKSSSPPTIGTPQHRACCLGRRLLLKTFKMHQIVQEEVLSQIVNRILTNAAGCVDHYISLLNGIIISCPHVALDSPPQLKEVFAYLSLLPASAAIDLLRAVLPMIQCSAAVRDSLILVLRKSLFSRQVESRKVAVGGYLLLLKNFIVLDSLNSADSQSSQTTHSTCSSQVTVEVHGGPSSNGALCLEILGTLRRSLTKQSDVRLSLYEGLYPVFSANSSLAEPIMDILVEHLQTYYEKEPDITPPIKLGLCVSTSGSDVIQVEPIDGLVQCLQLCVTKFSEWEETSNEARDIPPVIEEAQDILQSLVERMGKSDPEDFELDKSSDFTASSSVGQKNRNVARLVMGVYETLLEYTFTIGEFSQESCEQTLKLFQAYHRIATILQDKSVSVSTGTSKRGPHGAVQSRTVVYNLSLQCVIRLLKALFSDCSPNHQQPLSVLRDSTHFVKYVVNAALQKTHQLRDYGGCDGASVAHTTKRLFKQSCDLGKILFKQVETSGPMSAKKDKGKSNSVLCLEGFNQLLLTMSTWFSPSSPLYSTSQTRQGMSLDDFLVYVNPTLSDKDPNERIHYFIGFFERLVVSVISGHSKEWTMKDLQLMINMIYFLSKELDSESSELKDTFDWVCLLCKDQNVDDGPLTRSLVSLMLTLNARHKGSIKMVGKLAKDVHYHLGDIDEEVELEGETSFAIVNPRTAAGSILSLVYSHIDTILCDAEWLINRLKSEMSLSPAEDIFEGQKSLVGTQATDFCSTVCDRLVYVVSACSELVQTSISPGPTTDGMFKVVTKLFSILGNLTRYSLSVYPQTSIVIPSFRKLVTLVGKELCQQVYSSICYAQASVTGGDVSTDKGKKGAKKKGKSHIGGKTSIRREIRSVPNLIYAIEQLEKFLIKLDKKAKVNLMESFKRSTARDFRINTQLIDVGVEEDEEESDGGSDQEDGAPPKAKRMKRN